MFFLSQSWLHSYFSEGLIMILWTCQNCEHWSSLLFIFGPKFQHRNSGHVQEILDVCNPIRVCGPSLTEAERRFSKQRWFKPVVLNLFYISYPFINQSYQIYPSTISGAHFLKYEINKLLQLGLIHKNLHLLQFMVKFSPGDKFAPG